MIGLKPLAIQAGRVPLAADQIDSLQSSPFRIEAEDCETETVRPVDRLREHAMANEDQPPTTVCGDNQRGTLDGLQSEIASLVLNPAEITGGIEVAHLTRITRRNNCVGGTQIVHPLRAKLDRFISRGSPRSWVRRVSHSSRVHPSSDGHPTRPPVSARLDPVGGES
jgi:hypothetical protein